MRLFGYPYNDLVICKDSPDYLLFILTIGLIQPEKKLYLVFHMEANRTQLIELIVVIDAKVTSTELNLQM